jgi:uncharacterized membrane protein
MLFAALAVIAWGLWGLFGKIALERGMSSHAILVAEGVMGFLGGLSVLGALRLRRLPLPWEEAWNWYGFLSGAALAGGIGFYYVALRGARLSIVVPLTAVYPLVAVLLGMLFLGERLSPLQWAGIGLTTLGVALLVAEAQGSA